MKLLKIVQKHTEQDVKEALYVFSFPLPSKHITMQVD